MNAAVDSVAFFVDLADRMNADPERFASLGEAEMVVALVMDRPEGSFHVRLHFAGLRCTEVGETDAIGAGEADFGLEGPLEAWRQMFDDIVANGRATGLFTLNSLALMGDRISCTGDDPMGIDKFSRFNQTLQEFFDGAAREAATAG